MNTCKIVAGIAVWLTCMMIQADTITHNGATVDMAFAEIGSAGNAADSTGYGAVGYNYRIGTYEVTKAQWDTVAAAAGISESGVWSGSQPVASLSWYEAAQFCNWLTSGNKYTGAYQFNGSGILTDVSRVAAAVYGTVYVLPTEDEWYKAAYYTGNDYSRYANGTNTPPVAGTDANYNNAIGSPWNVGSGMIDQNGTYDMMGNVWEICESALDGTLNDVTEDRLARSGSFGSTPDRLDPQDPDARWELDPTTELDYIGFRVVAIPEPSTATLLFFISAAGFWIRRRFVD